MGTEKKLTYEELLKIKVSSISKRKTLLNELSKEEVCQFLDFQRKIYNKKQSIKQLIRLCLSM